MSIAARSPSARKSTSLSEHSLNLASSLGDVTSPIINREYGGGKKRAAMSLGGDVLNGHAKFDIGAGPDDGLSPRRRARRSMQPRKSILKSWSSHNIADNDENTTYFATFAHSQAHTLAFQFNESDTMRQSLARRVSFAHHAHVRMFEPNPLSQPAIPIVNGSQPQAITASNTNLISAHSRRSSFQNLDSVSNSVPNVRTTHTDDGGGEESMDIETASEASDSDDGNLVEMGRRRQHRISELGQMGLDDAQGEDVDIDETQVVGGIMPRQSVGNVSEQSIGSEGGQGDEEKTMDFTIAIGGMLPNSPPVHASTKRLSLGYSIPVSPNSQGQRFRPGEPVEGELDMELDETVAFGGIIGDDSITSGSDENTLDRSREKTMTFSFGDVLANARKSDAMDLTIAGGGIVSKPQASPYRSQTFTSATRPTPGTPSFARPTASSSSRSREPTPKERRNIFAPSPSPFKSTTPRKSGMNTAGEVAKRLSFGSNTSSGGKKRGREDDEMEARPTIADGVFSAGPSSRVKMAPSVVVSRPSPRKSMGTPMRNTKSPAKSPALRRMLGERPQVGDMPSDGDWDQPPTISLSAFLEMAGVQFMEGLPGLNKRRSSVAKGLLGSSYANGDREFALHEYAEAQVHSVFLNMYFWAANKMKDDITSGQADLHETDSLCSIDNPPVIREYLSASEEDKGLFEMTFKAFKTNTQLKAKERWYDWKMSLMERVRPDVAELLEGMREDSRRLDEMEVQVSTVVPELHARYAALEKELERERGIVAEVASCDQAELADYKAAIAEQATQISGFTSELNDSTLKLEALQSKLDELNTKKHACISAINIARSKCDQFTRSDVVRFKDEYESLQHLHQWKPIKIRPNALVLVYGREIRLSFTCKNHVPDLASAKVEMINQEQVSANKGKRYTPQATSGIFGLFQGAAKELSSRNLSAFVQRIGQLWTAAQRLRSELGILTLRHPVTFTPRPNHVVATTTIVLPSVKSKVEIGFILTPDVLYDWPNAVANVDVTTRVVYGTADPAMLEKTAKETLTQATSWGYVGAFLQSCVDAAGQYA